MKNINYTIGLLAAIHLLSLAATAGPVMDEGYLVDGVAGVIRKAANADVWNFVPEVAITAADETWPANLPLSLLPSSVLEQITGLAGDEQTIQVRLWGLFTEYQQQNYLYCIYFLPMQAAETPTAAEPKTDASNDDAATQAPAETDSIIPADILRQIKTTQAPDLDKFQQAAAVTGDVNLIARTGYLDKRGKVNYFQPNAFGQNVNRSRYILLPCEMLEATEKAMRQTPGQQRYEISGLVTSYKGRQYMLLRRAVRTYTNGNFTP
jgi:hypothetical protein